MTMEAGVVTVPMAVTMVVTVTVPMTVTMTVTVTMIVTMIVTMTMTMTMIVTMVVNMTLMKAVVVVAVAAHCLARRDDCLHAPMHKQHHDVPNSAQRLRERKGVVASGWFEFRRVVFCAGQHVAKRERNHHTAPKEEKPAHGLFP